MKTTSVNFIGQTKYWWMILLVGIVLVIGGFAYWFWPDVGFAVGSQIFGWMLIMTGIVQLCVSAGEHRPRGWGWWLGGGVVNMLIGFLLVRSIMLSEFVFPFFLAAVFIYAGVVALIHASIRKNGSYWWINLINGILLLIIGFFFVDAGYHSEMEMVSFVTSLGFIYWGLTLAMSAYELKPCYRE